MPELLSTELVRLRDDVVDLGHNVLLPMLSDESLNSSERHRVIVQSSKNLGLFGMTQPKEFGGSSASLLELTMVRDTLGSMNLSHLSGIFGPGPGVLAGVDEPLKSHYLAPVLAGEKRGAFGFTEPDSADRATWATLEGGKLTVNGQKSYVTGGADADFVNTLVEIEGHGPAMVLIDTSSASLGG